MRIFNEDVTEELNYNELDFQKGRLVEEAVVTPLIEGIEEQSHYEVIKEYPNGGKEVRKVIDVEGRPAIGGTQENVYIYKLYTQEELNEIELNNLRNQREIQCFPIINRGRFWYDTLTENQINELRIWYTNWLDVTETKIIPEKPEWLN